ILRRQRAIEIVPSGEPFRWRRYDIPQHLAPETSDALRFCAVEGDLELLDRRHQSTIEARVVGSHAGSHTDEQPCDTPDSRGQPAGTSPRSRTALNERGWPPPRRGRSLRSRRMVSALPNLDRAASRQDSAAAEESGAGARSG